MRSISEPAKHVIADDTSKKEYNAVDLFKFISCILVIIIHTKPFEVNFWLDAGFGLITRFAVPYFFVSSSFFLFIKLNKAEHSEKNMIFIEYLSRLIKFYVIWFIIQNTISTLRGYVHPIMYYVKQFILPTNGSPLWFLAALIFAAFLVYIMTKVLRPKIVFIIALAVFAVGYCFSTLAVVISGFEIFQMININIISTIGTQNGLFFAFPYVAMGAILAQVMIEKSLKRDTFYVIVFVCLLGVESIIAVLLFHAKLTYLWIFVLPLTYFAMRCALSMDLKGQYYLLRKMSTFIYVIHPIIMIYIKEALHSNIIGFADKYNLVLFLATALLSIIVTVSIIKLSACKKMRFLKHLY